MNQNAKFRHSSGNASLTIIILLIVVGALTYFYINKGTPASSETINNSAGLPEIKLIPKKTLLGNPDRTGVKINPDGSKLLYCSNLNGVLNTFIAPITNLDQAQAITNDKERGACGSWTYDPNYIVYTKDDGGDENYRLHIVKLDTKEDRTLTPEKTTVYTYAASDKFPQEIIIGLNDRDPQYHDVYKLNLISGQKQLILKNQQKFSGFMFDDNYQLKFAVKTTDNGGSEYFKAIAKGPNKYNWESFTRFNAEDTTNSGLIGLTKDGNTLYLLDSRGHDLNILKQINLTSGEESTIAQGNKSDIAQINASPIDGVIRGYSINYLKNEWFHLNDNFKNHMEYLTKNIIDGEINITSTTHNDKLWIVASIRSDGPVVYYLYNTVNQQFDFLFENREDLNNYQLAKMEGVIIPARDGLELPAYITKPLNATESVPMIIIVHGGPQARDYWGYNSEAQLFANRGYAVLQINFRGSAGFGKTFVTKGNLEWGRKMHYDILDGAKWAIDQKIADPNKIAIYGGSYGGYEALWCQAPILCTS